jgi:hypothetical protein
MSMQALTAGLVRSTELLAASATEERYPLSVNLGAFTVWMSAYYLAIPVAARLL